MALTLYYHPLSSFCHKALIALYENDTPFTAKLINLGEEASRAELVALWPPAKFPVLEDAAKGRVVPESSVIIEYLDLHYPGPVKLVPDDADVANEVRLRDRLYDLHVQLPMQKIVGDRIRPADKKDAHGVEQARAQLTTVYGLIENDLQNKTWAAGEAFGMADCAAAPALYYADKVQPFDRAKFPAMSAYLERLLQRPSVARVHREMAPYLAFFPKA